MDLGLTGKVALVAASSSGLGLAAAQALAGEGASVVINGRDPDRLAAAEQQLRAQGATVFAISGDIAEPKLPARLVGAAVERFGHLDVVVANAGGPPAGRALDVSDDQLRAAVEASFLSAVRLVRAARPHFAGWGRICCISSASIVQAMPGLALSNAARSGLWGWAKTAAGDLRGEGVTLNLACPGPHATRRMVELGGSSDALEDPERFGQVVAFLCSEPAAGISGTAVLVDGARSLAL